MVKCCEPAERSLLLVASGAIVAYDVVFAVIQNALTSLSRSVYLFAYIRSRRAAVSSDRYHKNIPDYHKMSSKVRHDGEGGIRIEGGGRNQDK